MKTTASALLLAAMLPATALAAIQTEMVEYQDGDQNLSGYLVYDDSLEGPRPGVLVVHEWWGLNDYAKQRAEMLAELGYVAFAVDMYGDDRVTSHAPDAQGWMKQITGNVEAWRQRAQAGLDVLANHERVAGDDIAAIGYCFGGATVMQMAYAGADLDGVVSFHGSLPPAPEGTQIEPAVLIAHGYDDSFVPVERIRAFEQSMAASGADWQFVTYADARHGFTNPGAGDYGIDGLRYNPEADTRSWRLMQDFLNEVFAD